MYLAPTKTIVIPVHPATFGYDKQKLAVDIHEFPSSTNSSNGDRKKTAYLFSHSNGFHKEAFHPLMRRFIDYLRSQEIYSATDITFISWDARNHGDSARINDGTLQDSCKVVTTAYCAPYTAYSQTEKYLFSVNLCTLDRWSDNAMDTKQIIDELQLKENYDHLIGVGHSFGATSMLLCEFYYPNSFEALCVIEPVLSSFMIPQEIREQFPVLASRKRRDEWADRRECKQNLLKKAFFKLLHPEVLDLYVDYGLYDTDKGTVKLKCPREQEFHVFNVSQYDNYIGYLSLKSLEIPVHFVYALGSSFCSPEEARTIVDENKQKITIDFIEGTHMVPNEKPELVIPQIRHLLQRINNNPSNDTIDHGLKSKL